MWRILLLLILWLPALAWADGPIVGASCGFTWEAPTTNADGSPLTDLKEYRLCVSTISGSYGTPSAVIPAGTTQVSCAQAGISGDGQYYAIVRAYDQALNPSAPSPEVAFVRDTVAPGAPMTFSIVLELQGTVTVAPVAP